MERSSRQAWNWSGSNGMRLLTLCSEHNLTITSTIFQQKNKYKTSWMHPSFKHWHLIDYVIMKRCDIRDVLRTRFMRGPECWTDHCMIMAKVSMRVRPPLQKRGPSGRRLDCACPEDNNARNDYQCSLAEKHSEVKLILSGENATDQQWISISSVHHEAAAHTISCKSRNHQEWVDNNSDTIHNSLNTMHKAHGQKPIIEHRQTATAERRKVRKVDEKYKGLCGPCRTSGGWKSHRRSIHFLIEMTHITSTTQSNRSAGQQPTVSPL